MSAESRADITPIDAPPHRRGTHLEKGLALCLAAQVNIGRAIGVDQKEELDRARLALAMVGLMVMNATAPEDQPAVDEVLATEIAIVRAGPWQGWIGG